MHPIKLKQPKALSVFFLTEMWERYGFAVIELLLILYFINVLHLSDTFSYGILGSITALAYVNSVIGGYLADRFIGHRYSILLGAVFLAVFYGLIGVVQNLDAIAWSLSLFTLGTGMLKPNVSSLIGTLYHENDERRYSGFTIFYVGINLGNTLGASLPSYIQRDYGWHIMYLSAMILMIIAFFTFWLGARYFKIRDVQNIRHYKKDWILAVVIMLLVLIFSYYIIKHQEVALAAFSVVAIIAAVIVIYISIHEHGRVRSRILAYLALVVMSVIFWALFFQIFFSMNLFIDRAVNHHMFGLNLTTSTFAAIDSFGVIIMGIFLGWLWTKLKDSPWNPSAPMKFSLGFWALALMFGVLYLSIAITGKDGLVLPEMLILVYLLLALAELFLSPTGLAMVTELVPQRLVGVMMGIFFISLGLGGKLAGVLADVAAVPQSMTDINQIEHIYRHAFWEYFLICFVVGVLSLACVPILKRLMNTKY